MPGGDPGSEEPHRVKIACRDESKHAKVKQVVEAKLTRGVRILRDDLYPIRVDSVNRMAILDEKGGIRARATEVLGKENDTQVAKAAWLSDKDNSKAYGSMVVYLSKRADVQRFLRERLLYARGESVILKPLSAGNAPSSTTTAKRSPTTKPTSAPSRRSTGNTLGGPSPQQNAPRPW